MRRHRTAFGIGWTALTIAQFACSGGGDMVPLPGTLPLGSWGGDSAGMTVTDSGMHVQIACTYGDVTGTVPIAADGSFDVAGSYMLHAYPIALLPADPAQFHGYANGSAVTITVVVDDTAQHQSVTRGPVTLRLDGTPHWGPCPL